MEVAACRLMSGLLSLSVMAAWVGACVKVVFVFCGIVMVRICTPRLGLGALGRMAWGSIFMYLTFFYLIYLVALVWL